MWQNPCIPLAFSSLDVVCLEHEVTTMHPSYLALYVDLAIPLDLEISLQHPPVEFWWVVQVPHQSLHPISLRCHLLLDNNQLIYLWNTTCIQIPHIRNILTLILLHVWHVSVINSIWWLYFHLASCFGNHSVRVWQESCVKFSWILSFQQHRISRQHITFFSMTSMICMQLRWSLVLSIPVSNLLISQDILQQLRHLGSDFPSK